MLMSIKPFACLLLLYIPGRFAVAAVAQPDRRAVRTAEGLLRASAPGGAKAVGVRSAARRPSLGCSQRRGARVRWAVFFFF